MKRAKTRPSGATYRIDLSYAPEVLFPSEALGRDFYERARPDSPDLFLTNDGKLCRPTYIMTWSEVEEEKMDSVCERWGCKFSQLRSAWLARLRVRYGMNCWHLVKLDIVDERE